jgi:chemotaxis protein CheX
MSTTATRPVTELLNGMLHSLNSIVPLPYEKKSPQLLNSHLNLEFGVLIGFTGDLKGKLVFKGDPSVFSSIGEVMFGMPLEGEMLSSFAGELGNMLSGSLCTYLSEKGTVLDITSPTMIEGNSKLSGFESAIEIEVVFDGKGSMFLYMLKDK